jgi:hypothetical protein
MKGKTMKANTKIQDVPDGEVDPKRDTLLTVIVKCSDRVGKKYAGCKKVKCDNGARYVYIDFDRMVHYDPED